MYYKTTIASLALIGAVDASHTSTPTEDESWTNTLESCQYFAWNFESTCDSAGNLNSMRSVTVTCDDVEACAGTESGRSCSWERKLCVTCRDDGGTIKIRAQTNGLPNHCYRSP